MILSAEKVTRNFRPWLLLLAVVMTIAYHLFVLHFLCKLLIYCTSSGSIIEMIEILLWQLHNFLLLWKTTQVCLLLEADIIFLNFNFNYRTS